MAFIGNDLVLDSLGSTYASTAPPPYTPGHIAWDNRGNAYRFIYNTGSTKISQYYAAQWNSTGSAPISGGSDAYVVVGVAAGRGLEAGIAVTDIDSGEYGWLCVKGWTKATGDAVATAGWPLILTAGAILATSTNTANATNQVARFAGYQISTLTTAKYVKVDCL